MMKSQPLETLRGVAKLLLASPEKIVCLGLGKTGTTSFADAMIHLGYHHKTMGFRHAFDNRRYLPIRYALMRHDSFDDFPWNYLYEKIDRWYPRARFVLTTRSNSEIWYDSLVRHFMRGSSVQNHFSFYGYKSPLNNKRHFINLYESHNERVRDYFRGCPRFAEMCWEKGDGWQELCGFVDAPVPTIPFPHSNIGSAK